MAASLQDRSANYRIVKWIFFGLSVALSLFLIINGAINGEKSAEESNFFARLFADIVNAFRSGSITDDNFASFAYIIRKLLGHFLAFAFDGCFIALASYYFLIDKKWYKFYLPIIISLLLGLFVAGFSEFLQVFTADRYGSFVDVGIDMGGFVLGMLIVFIVLLITKNLIIKSNCEVK